MKALLFIGGRLFFICAAAAFALGLVNAVTEPITEERRQRELQEALARLFPDGVAQDAITVEDSKSVAEYYPVHKDGGLVGYILSLREMGYGGEMTILAGFLLSGEILSAVLMENLETPGLGKKAESAAYMDRFIGTGGARAVPVRKGMLGRDEADAITGASITFMAIGRSLAAGVTFVQDLR